MPERYLSLRAAACVLCAAGALAAGAALLRARTANAANASAAEPAPSAAVQIVPVSRKPVSQQVVAYGVVGMAGANALTVSLPYVARVVRVLAQQGQTVARGTALFVVQADPSAVVAFTQARSAVTLARGELTRTRALYRDGLATQSQLAAAQKALDDAQQALAAQNTSGIEANAKTITAPVAGVVSQLSAAPGDQTQAGAALAQLVGANAAGTQAGNVSLGVEPADAAAIRAGDRVVLHPLSAVRQFVQAQGQVALVGAAIDAQSQLVNLGANVPLAGTVFLPGTRVRAEIDTQPGTWWEVPRAAVLQDAQGTYVFQVMPGNKAHRVAVAVKVEHSGSYGVDGALDAARGLVVSGNYELEDGMAVRVTHLGTDRQGGRP